MLDKKVYIIICFFFMDVIELILCFFLWDTYLVTSCMLHSERQTDLFENYKQRMAEKTTIETQLKNLTIQVSSEPQK